MPKRGATNHKDIVGKQIGQLIIVLRVGRKKYSSFITPLWLCKCKEKGHLDIRSGVSLRATGDNTTCKTCYKLRTRRGIWPINSSALIRAELTIDY